MRGVRLEVWGDYALFSRPEMKVERVSYEVMTPSAARGILDAIYWHPGMCWKVKKIHVLAPIRMTNIRRNEVKSKISASNVRTVMTRGTGELFLDSTADRQQRAALLLQDVHYVIEAEFILQAEGMAKGDNEGKFSNIIHRRIEKGQCYHMPYLGCREFPAHFRAWEGETIPTAYPQETRHLGFMLYDMDYKDSENIQPMFFPAVLAHGVLDVSDCEVYR